MKTVIIKVNPKRPNRIRLLEAARIIREGGLVAFPTETVYGLGCDWQNEAARSRLYQLKERPLDKPLSIHIARAEDLGQLGVIVGNEARELIEEFWPGPLTLIFLKKSGGKIGVRFPDNRVAQELIAESKTYLLGTSANISGTLAPVKAEEVARIFSGKIEVIVDGGETRLGQESTVVDLTTSPFMVKREGALAFLRLAEVLGGKIIKEKKILLVCTGNSCRSAMAEGYLKFLLKDKPRFKISSCGTAALAGAPPTAEAVTVMKEAGIDISAHRGRRLSPELIREADLVLVMEGMHKDIIFEEYPKEEKNKVYLLRDYGTSNPRAESDIPDPIGQPLEEYRRIFRIIQEALERIARIL